MRKIVFAALATVLAGSAAAQDHNLSIGGGSASAGGLDMSFYSKGNSRDTGAFNPGSGGQPGNVWNSVFFFYDGTTAAYADQNFATHTNQLVNGTVSSTGTSFTNNGITFGSTTPIANLTGNLAVTLSAPTAGDTAQVQYDWTFNNSGGAPINLRVVYFLDADVSVGGGAFGTNKVAFTNIDPPGYTIRNTKGAIAIGDVDGSGNVDLNDGILIDSDKEPTYLFGLQDTGGPSFWWSNQNNYAAKGIEVVNAIDPTFQNIVQGDANADYLADAGADSGAAAQWDIVIPASGSNTLSINLVFGLNDTVGGGEISLAPSSVESWMNY